MSRSVLLQLARDSIQEVFEAQKTIDKTHLLQEHPLLAQNIATTVNIYLEDELRGSSSSSSPARSLLEDVILNSKKSAFEDKNFSPLRTSEYLSCEIELILRTDDGVLKERDSAIIKNNKEEIHVLRD